MLTVEKQTHESSKISVSTDIQEFYEVTLLNTQTSCEQKLEEVNYMADKWEQSVSLPNSELASPVEKVSQCIRCKHRTYVELFCLLKLLKKMLE